MNEDQMVPEKHSFDENKVKELAKLYEMQSSGNAGYDYNTQYTDPNYQQ